MTYTVVNLSVPTRPADYFASICADPMPAPRNPGAAPNELEPSDASGCSTLNPRNFNWSRGYVYGTLPTTLTRLIAERTGRTGADDIQMIGRGLSVGLDIVTLLALFALGVTVYDRRVGLLAAALYAGAVMPIQQSHFFTVDNFAVCFGTLALLFITRLGRNGRLSDAVWSGIWIAAAVASKINMAALVGLVFVAIGMQTPEGKRQGARGDGIGTPVWPVAAHRHCELRGVPRAPARRVRGAAMVEHRVFHLLRRAAARRNRGIAGCDPAPGSALRKRPAPVGGDGRRHDRPAVEYSMGRSNAVAVSAAKHGAVGHGLAARHRGLEHVGRGRLGDAHTAALEPLDTLDLGGVLFRLAGSAIRHHDALLPADLSAAAYVRRLGHARAVAQPAAHAGADDGYPVRHFAAAAGRPSASPFDHSRRHRVRGAGNLGLGLGLYADLYSPLHSHRRGGLDTRTPRPAAQSAPGRSGTTRCRCRRIATIKSQPILTPKKSPKNTSATARRKKA